MYQLNVDRNAFFEKNTSSSSLSQKYKHFFFLIGNCSVKYYNTRYYIINISLIHIYKLL